MDPTLKNISKQTEIPVSEIPAAPTRKPFHKSPILLMSLFVLLVIGAFFAGTYYQGASKENEKPQAVATSPTPASPTPTIDPTADWKAFIDQKYNFSFKYPASFDDKCCNLSGPANTGARKIVVLADPTTVDKGSDKPFNGFAVYVDLISSGKSFEQYINEEKAKQLSNKKEFSGKNEEGTQASITVAEQQGVVLKGYSWDGVERLYLPFIDNKNVLIIAKNQLSAGSFDEVFDQILKTFKFLDTEATNSASN